MSKFKKKTSMNGYGNINILIIYSSISYWGASSNK